MDPKFRVPRVWSNRELARFAPLVTGRVANVSGWKDIDKEGRRYRDYFSAADEYWVTNYKSEARGFQGTLDNELFLDLTAPLDPALHGRFDAVFNHTVLEHIFELDTAFANLCRLTRDLAIVVVPFVQEEHADYGDYWRFTPQAVERLFRAHGLETLYLSCNDGAHASIYVFAIASRRPEAWPQLREAAGNRLPTLNRPEARVGTQLFRPRRLGKLLNRLLP